MSGLIYGVGFNSAPRTGYLAKIGGAKGKIIREYDYWRRMLQRSYDSKYKILHPTYEGCSVIEEWWDWQNFYPWCKKQKSCDKPDLDKDLLLPGNKIYCPEFCCFLPEEINKAIVVKGSVSVWHKRDSIWETSYRGEYLGRSNNSLTYAGIYFKKRSERLLQLISKYEDKLSSEAYDALLKYSLEADCFGKIRRVT